MRQGHFAALQPLCPRCQLAGHASHLQINSAWETDGDIIWMGILHCPANECRLEFPIIDGVPIIVADVRSYLASSGGQLLRRHDLPESLETLLGDASGPASEFDQTRQHLSIYAWSHYGEFDELEDEDPATDGIVECLNAGISLGIGSSPAIDLGCAVGRTTFELAMQTGGQALGIDANFAMLQMAQRLLRFGEVTYERRRTGLVYDRRKFAVRLPGAHNADFWACDALALPFDTAAFGTALALNLLDCVASPVDLLREIQRLLRPGGRGIIATPFDWSPAATAVEAWIGGHSQRGRDGGDGPSRLLTALGTDTTVAGLGGLEVMGNVTAVNWRARLHSRSSVSYRNYVLGVRRI